MSLSILSDFAHSALSMLLLWCLLPAAALVTQPAVGGRELAHRRIAAPPVAMAARSKEAEANMKKWGKILSQADTFDDSAKYLRKGKGAKKAAAPDKSAGGAVVAAASAAIVLAMVVASAGTAPG